MQPNQMPAYPSPQVVPIQAVTHAQVPPGPSKYSCAAKSLGILQILLAVGSATPGIVNIVGYGSYLGFIASPIWGGLLFYLPAGILGVVAGCAPHSSRRCVAIAWMVMSILAACIGGGNIVYAGISIYNDIHVSTTLAVAMDGVLVFVSLAELIIAIVSAAYCCLIMGELPRQNFATVQYTTVPAYPTTVMSAPNPPAYTATPNAHVVVFRGDPAGGAPSSGYYPSQTAPNYMMGQAAVPGTAEGAPANTPETKQ